MHNQTLTTGILLTVEPLTLYHTIKSFNNPEEETFENIVDFFSHEVFYPVKNKLCHLS